MNADQIAALDRLATRWEKAAGIYSSMTPSYPQHNASDMAKVEVFKSCADDLRVLIAKNS